MGPAGDFVMKYPMGLSILYSPLFFTGHLFAQVFGYPADGFSLPYQVSIALGGVLYTFIGLWFFRKALLHFFSDPVAAGTILVVVLGTNYFELTTLDNAMPHNYLFTVFAIILYLTIKWHENPKFRYAVPLGILCGMSILIRPTSGIIMLAPLLWGLWGKSGFAKKMELIGRNYRQVLSMIILVAILIGFQLLYWKLHAGTWLYYSYEKGEALEWIAPYLSEVLFSYRKGWLIYTPVMIFAILGFIPMAIQFFSLKENDQKPLWRKGFILFFLIFTVHLLIVASWPTWWYGGSFGQRTMMEYYVVLSIPLGAFISCIAGWKRYIRGVVFTILILFIGFNLFQTWQYTHGIIDASRMTKSYYWRTFGKTSVSDRDKMYLVPVGKNEDREGLPVSDQFTAKMLARYDFEDADPANTQDFCMDTARSGKYSMHLNKTNEFSPGIKIPYNQLSQQDFAWVQACGFIYFTCKPEEVGVALVVTCMQKGAAYKYRLISLDKENLKPNEWNQVCMDYMAPYLEDPTDVVQAYFWCRGEKEVLVDDIEIKLFEFQ